MYVTYLNKLPRWLSGKESVNAQVTGDPCLIHGLGRSPEGVNGNPLQYSCQDNPMGRVAWQATVHGVTESDINERLNTQAHKHLNMVPGK